jgi:hypothetical protein
MNRIGLSFLFCVFSSNLFAFPCYITLMKQNCWKGYAVSVKIADAETTKDLVTAKVAEDAAWSRTQFACEPHQTLYFVAQYAPAIWQGEEDKTFAAKRNWFLPEKITPEVVAWNINLCFPTDFSSVPLPPNIGNDCRCDVSQIPKIE